MFNCCNQKVLVDNGSPGIVHQHVDKSSKNRRWILEVRFEDNAASPWKRRWRGSGFYQAKIGKFIVWLEFYQEKVLTMEGGCPFTERALAPECFTTLYLTTVFKRKVAKLEFAYTTGTYHRWVQIRESAVRWGSPPQSIKVWNLNISHWVSSKIFMKIHCQWVTKSSFDKLNFNHSKKLVNWWKLPAKSEGKLWPRGNLSRMTFISEMDPSSKDMNIPSWKHRLVGKRRKGKKGRFGVETYS